jgi:hypothetical protein
MALELPTIAGNHERQLLTLPPERLAASDAHAATQLDERRRAWLAWLPAELRLADDVLCCHGTPSSDLVYFLETATPDGLRAATPAEALGRAGQALGGVPHALILCGHTHVPRVDATARWPARGQSRQRRAAGVCRRRARIRTVSRTARRMRATPSSSARRQVAGGAAQHPVRPRIGGAPRRGAQRPDWAHALRTGFVASAP